jgi:hypothetical protein
MELQPGKVRAYSTRPPGVQTRLAPGCIVPRSRARCLDPLLVEPDVEIRWVEADETPDLEERNAALRHETLDVAPGDSECESDSIGIEQRRLQCRLRRCDSMRRPPGLRSHLHGPLSEENIPSYLYIYGQRARRNGTTCRSEPRTNSPTGTETDYESVARTCRDGRTFCHRETPLNVAGHAERRSTGRQSASPPVRQSASPPVRNK